MKTKSAWSQLHIQHEVSINSEWSQYQFSMKSASIQHEVSINSEWSQYRFSITFIIEWALVKHQLPHEDCIRFAMKSASHIAWSPHESTSRQHIVGMKSAWHQDCIQKYVSTKSDWNRIWLNIGSASHSAAHSAGSQHHIHHEVSIRLSTSQYSVPLSYTKCCQCIRTTKLELLSPIHKYPHLYFYSLTERNYIASSHWM